MHAVIFRTLYIFNKTISRPPQSRETIPLNRKTTIYLETASLIFAHVRCLIFCTAWA
jgi:hypothetical protein